MIQANEFRIGNWIRKIDGRGNYQVDAEILCSIANSAIEEMEEEPIPLTEKWLLDFGFEEKENEFYFIKIWETADLIWSDDGSISIEQDEYAEIHNVSTSPKDIEIMYVHQLQNLYFALSGKELNLLNHAPVTENKTP